MAKYNVVFSCGHEAEVELFGPETERRKKIEYFKDRGICPECYNALKAAEADERKAAMEALGLPELTGSPKQVAWAEKLRESRIKEISDTAKNLKKREDAMKEALAKMKSEGKDTTREEGLYDSFREKNAFLLSNVDAPEKIFAVISDARWYIDTQYEFESKILKDLEERMAKFEISVQPEAIAYEAEITVEPENMEHDTLVTVFRPNGYNCVAVKSDYDKELVEFVKSRGYKWDGKDKEWIKNMMSTDGAYEDRIAEIGNALLNAGWPVRIPDAAAREKAVNGTYEPRYPRWIVKGKSDDRLYIQWDNDNDDMTEKVKKFAKYDRYKDYYYLPISHAAEILEFAELNDFRIAPEAKDRIDAYISSRIKVEVKDGAKVEMKSEEEKLKDILESKPVVLNRLVEDDIDDD